MADKLSYFTIRLDSVDSTNKYVRENILALRKQAAHADAIVVTASEQTAGRGQRGNVWHSAAGENMLMSILVAPRTLSVSKQFALSQIVALALCDAMTFFGIAVQIKWPNDIYAGDKKLAGVLVELDYAATNVEQAIIGVGLNVNQRDFPAMSRVPVSMSELLNKKIPLCNVEQAFLNAFSARYPTLCQCAFDDIDSEYVQRLKGYGCLCRYKDGNGLFSAKMVGVSPEGCLLLQRTDGTLLQYAFKQVEQLF